MSGTALDPAYTLEEAEAVRKQLDLLTNDEGFRSSRRSVAFLRYIVEQTLAGNAEDLKERTIGVNVFGKNLTYDTSLDHAVRTAASELRKRLAIYYGSEAHRDELRIQLVPGSYVPHFVFSPQAEQGPKVLEQRPTPLTLAVTVDDKPLEASGVEPKRRGVVLRHKLLFAVVFLAIAGAVGYSAWTKLHPSPFKMFWNPVLKADGNVLIAVGDVPNGPPVPTQSAALDAPPLPTPASPGVPTVPFADSIAIARVASVFSTMGKEFVIRRENSSSFADLRERPVVLIGAFNNEWSLRLTRELRFSLAMDTAKRVIYIRDRKNPQSRDWAWSIDKHPEESARTSNVPLHDYALLTRILDSETGHDVVVIGGLYTYGTQAAGEFVSSPQLMEALKGVPLDQGHRRLQIVLETQVTEGTPGPPRIVAVSAE